MKKIVAILAATLFAVSISMPASAADAFATKWGTFKAFTLSGFGDDVVQIPSALKAGFVTSTHDGESNFVVWALDTSLEKTSLVVNTIGTDPDVRDFGLSYGAKRIKAFEVSADGNWSITVKPVSVAPSLPSSGFGAGVFKVTLKSKPIWQTTHVGEDNFIIWQYCTSGSTTLVANGIGNYKAKKVGTSGSCILTVQGDGKWTIKK